MLPMIEPDLLKRFNVTEEDLRNTPPSVLSLLMYCIEQIAVLTRRVEELEAKLKANSSNSSKPPSSDNPLTRKSPSAKNGKAGAKPGHKGHRQALLSPTEVRTIMPERCSACGCETFSDTEDYYTHQVIELPDIAPEVIHFVLRRGKCSCCGKTGKAVIPFEHRAGFGPKLSALMAEMAGSCGDSRAVVRDFCSSVLGFHISLGAVQKVIDRASRAVIPHYNAIAEQVRSARINHVDETSWRTGGSLSWLWVMANQVCALFMVHTNRSGKAFQQLIRDWEGILVSDGYSIYCKWVGLRQTCLAHLIRDAKGLSERSDPEIARFGTWATSELQKLCHMSHETPMIGEWRAFYARFIHLITRNIDRPDAAGRFARRLHREIDSLWLFLVEQGVSPTNNHAERMLRFAVLWRKRSQGTAGEKGDKWVERILTLRQTCRLQSKSTYYVLVEALKCSFKGETPDLTWIAGA